MNIGIDIDGVLTNLEEYAINNGIKMCIEEGWKVDINPEEYWETKKFNWTEEQEEKFWNKYLEPYVLETRPREYAVEIIKKLREEGDKIYIITARNESGLPPESYGKMQEFTKAWLKKNGIEYDKLIFAGDKEKLQQCLENDVDFMIEDSPNNILNISTQVPVIKYECKYNKKIAEKNITPAYGWYHIYNIINKERRNNIGPNIRRCIKNI